LRQLIHPIAIDNSILIIIMLIISSHPQVNAIFIRNQSSDKKIPVAIHRGHRLPEILTTTAD
jgi:hypothetical protein